MDLIGFFKKDKYSIPIVFETDDFQKELLYKLDEYINDLKKENVKDNIIYRISSFKRYCGNALNSYLKGSHYNAFSNFKKAIESLDITESPIFKSQLKEKEMLFRGRINSDVNHFNDCEMFHIPLNRRRIVSGQRYSFPGLPCLYMSASAYTCWVELNKPSFDAFQVAMYKPVDDTAEIIDLSRIPQQLDNADISVLLDDYLCYWPILAVCSVKVKSEKDSFKPEYIFPQFFLEYIHQKNNSYIGIKYASIKASEISSKQLYSNNRTFINYVFPSSSDSMDKINDDILHNKFTLIHNRSGKELQIISSIQQMEYSNIKINKEPSEADDIISEFESMKLFTSDGFEYSYDASPFGMIELALRRNDFNFNIKSTYLNRIEFEGSSLMNVLENSL